MTRWLLLAPALLLPCGLAGCMNGSDALVAHLVSCGLASEGEVGPAALLGIYAPTSCYQDCLAQADCDRLEAALCRSSVELLVACDDRCALRCGDGSLIGIERRCDGVMHCEDGSDEQGCGAEGITCRSGATVRGARCDGTWSCSDGTDEEGCVRPRCDGFREIYPYERCDGYRACGDGTDEEGCPAYRCAGGFTFTFRPEADDPRCDGIPQCGDGSDEAGCAHLTPMCTGL